MEIILAKLYLSVVFGILLSSSLFLVLQIKLKQNLEKELKNLQTQIIVTYESNFKKGQIYLRQKIYKKAIVEFSNCFNDWDKNDRLGLASLLNTIGFMYFQLKEYTTATYYYKLSLILTPDYLTSLINLAYIYQTQGYLNNLKSLYKKLRKIAPMNKNTIELREYLEKRFI